MPKNTVYVGRPTKWGNPLQLIKGILYIDAGYRRKIFDKWVICREYSDIDDMIHLYFHIVLGSQFINPDLQYWSDKYKQYNIKELKGKNFSCWCSLDKPCHADILLRIANS